MNHTSSVGDILAGIAAYGSFLSFLPSILSSLAAIGSIIWYGIRIYDYFKNRRTPEVPND
jgi:hypothetical protein